MKKSIKILFNWSKANWKIPESNKNVFLSSNQDKLCPICGLKRNNLIFHFIWICNGVNKSDDLQWYRNKNFDKNIDFLEGVQNKIDSNTEQSVFV